MKWASVACLLTGRLVGWSSKYPWVSYWTLKLPPKYQLECTWECYKVLCECVVWLGEWSLAAIQVPVHLPVFRWEDFACGTMCSTHVAHISTPITSPTVNHPAANIPKVLCPHCECLDLCFPAGRWGPIQYYEGGFNVVAVGCGAFKKKIQHQSSIKHQTFQAQPALYSQWSRRGAILTTICKLLVCLIIIHQSLNHG